MEKRKQQQHKNGSINKNSPLPWQFQHMEHDHSAQGKDQLWGYMGETKRDVGRENAATCLEPTDLQLFSGLFLPWKARVPKSAPKSLPIT